MNIVLAAITSAIISAAISLFISGRAIRRGRRKVADAIWFHIRRSIETLEPILDEKNLNLLEEKIENDASYMPYMPWSTGDDLTYDQVIEALEKLNDEEEEILMSYFHNHQGLHALVDSLTLGFVREFPKERKLKWLKDFRNYGNENSSPCQASPRKKSFRKMEKIKPAAVTAAGFSGTAFR
ncbi:MAG: hypothetical protein MPK11_06010 [Gammaproteobacteria bacterium]|nr:hypothetical protein [Gammaproteobacteria bacterium]CAJ2376645.1 MAG: hypothetical protein IBGAMO2_400018 [Arenicellales bacterium IbO2]MDA7961400.1 hypothetical protein [Gammaproteobacteria bacterium]MDA7970311.1 hypothetical protein [Gammaproteobacteria bacterium]MDA7996292.1 hypothetical protein [Gammaproteobacteria bacterium]